MQNDSPKFGDSKREIYSNIPNERIKSTRRELPRTPVKINNRKEIIKKTMVSKIVRIGSPEKEMIDKYTEKSIIDFAITSKSPPKTMYLENRSQVNSKSPRRYSISPSRGVKTQTRVDVSIKIKNKKKSFKNNLIISSKYFIYPHKK